MERRPDRHRAWRADPAQGFRHHHALLAFPAADHRGGARPVPRRRLRAGARLRHHHRRRRCLLRRAGAEIRRRHRRDDPALGGRPEDRQGDHPTGEDRIPAAARARDRHGQPRRAGGAAGADRARHRPATSRRSIPIWSSRPSARSTAPSRRRTCWKRWRRRSPSTSRSKARARPTRSQFMEIARRDGLKAALAWRDARFPARRNR